MVGFTSIFPFYSHFVNTYAVRTVQFSQNTSCNIDLKLFCASWRFESESFGTGDGALSLTLPVEANKRVWHWHNVNLQLARPLNQLRTWYSCVQTQAKETRVFKNFTNKAANKAHLTGPNEMRSLIPLFCEDTVQHIENMLC